MPSIKFDPICACTYLYAFKPNLEPPLALLHRTIKPQERLWTMVSDPRKRIGWLNPGNFKATPMIPSCCHSKRWFGESQIRLSWKRFKDRRVKAVFRHGPQSKCVDLACDTESSLAATGRNGLLMTSYRTQRMLPSPLTYPIQCTARLRINKFTALSQFWVKATLNWCVCCVFGSLCMSQLQTEVSTMLTS